MTGIRWRLVRTVVIPESQMDKLVVIPGTLTKPYLKVAAVSFSTTKKKVKGYWRRAGYLRSMVVSGSTKAETASRLVPLNRESILKFPLSPVPAYSLQFKPQFYLPNLRFSVWEIVGDDWIPEDLNADDGEILDDGEF
jgi:hypothetical protein